MFAVFRWAQTIFRFKKFWLETLQHFSGVFKLQQMNSFMKCWRGWDETSRRRRRTIHRYPISSELGPTILATRFSTSNSSARTEPWKFHKNFSFLSSTAPRNRNSTFSTIMLRLRVVSMVSTTLLQQIGFMERLNWGMHLTIREMANAGLFLMFNKQVRWKVFWNA